MASVRFGFLKIGTAEEIRCFISMQSSVNAEYVVAMVAQKRSTAQTPKPIDLPWGAHRYSGSGAGGEGVAGALAAFGPPDAADGGPHLPDFPWEHPDISFSAHPEH